MNIVWESIVRAWHEARSNGDEFLLVFNDTEYWEPTIYAAKDVGAFWEIYENSKKISTQHLEYSFSTKQPEEEITAHSAKKEIPNRPIKRSEITTSIGTNYGNDINTFFFSVNGQMIGEYSVSDEEIVSMMNKGMRNFAEFYLQIWAAKNGIQIMNDVIVEMNPYDMTMMGDPQRRLGL